MCVGVLAGGLLTTDTLQGCVPEAPELVAVAMRPTAGTLLPVLVR